MEDNYSGSTTNTPANEIENYPETMRQKVALCKHITLPPYKQVRGMVMNRISGLIRTKHMKSLWTGRRIRSTNEIHDVVANKPFKSLSTNFSTVKYTLPEGMAISYATRIPAFI